MANYNLQFDLLKEGDEKKILEETYLNLIRDVSDLEIRSGHAFTGWTLEQIEMHNPAFIKIVESLLEENLIELIGHTYGHCILSIIPEWEVDAQIRKGIDTEERILGQRSTGFYPPEWVIDPTIPWHLNKSGFRWMVLHESNISEIYENVEKDVFTPKYIKGVYNSKIPTVFKYGGRNLVLRRYLYDVLENKRPAEDFVNIFIESSRIELKNPLLIFYMDSESPFFATTKENQNPQKKVRKIFELLLKQEEIVNLTISEYLNKFRPEKTIIPKYHANYKPITIWTKGFEKLDLLLNEARNRLLAKQIENIDKETLEEAWKCIMLAEGSDNRSAISDTKLRGIEISGRKIYGNYHRLIQGYEYVKRALELLG